MPLLDEDSTDIHAVADPVEDTSAFAAVGPVMALASAGPAAMRSGWAVPAPPPVDDEPSAPPVHVVAAASALLMPPPLPAPTGSPAAGPPPFPFSAPAAPAAALTPAIELEPATGVPDDLAGLAADDVAWHSTTDVTEGSDAAAVVEEVDVAAPTTDALDGVDGVDGVRDVDAVAADDDDLDEEASGARSRRPLVLLGTLGVVAVGAAVAAFVWPGLLVAADPAPAPSAPRPAAVTVTTPVTLQTPAQIGGLTRVTGAADEALATATSSTALTGLSAAVSAVYGIGATPAATVIAWTSATPLEPSAISSAFAGFQSTSGTAVGDIVATPVGAAGGQMSCGTTVVNKLPATLCFWTDAASFGSVTVLSPASPQSGVETAIAIRSGVQSTS